MTDEKMEIKLPYPKDPYIGDDMHPMTEEDWDPTWDAWKKADAIRKLNTKTWEIRSDIRVDAMGIDRGVRVTLIHKNAAHPLDIPRWHSTGSRSTSTMRELAQAILDACDFVEEKNPKWAGI